MVASRAISNPNAYPIDDRDAIDAALSEMCEDPFSGDFKVFAGPMDFDEEFGIGASCSTYEEAKVIIVTGIKRRGSNTY